MPKFPWRALLLISLIALIGRILLLASGSVSFHSDEAIIGLMARHINAGARPTFFYGQAYMGSLDAWLVALGFRLLGDSLLTIRIVQSLLYLGVVATCFLLGWQLSGRRIAAGVTGLIFALASPLVATYTTASLGGYNEILLLGNIVLFCGYRVINRPGPQLRAWAVLGFCAGLGWWVNGLIVMYLLPVGLLGLLELIRRLRRRGARPFLLGIGIAALCFVIGSAPWWVYDLQNEQRALNFYLHGEPDPDALQVSSAERIFGLVLFGLPVLAGARFPWLSSYFLLPLGLLVIFLYVMAAYQLLRTNRLYPGARALLLSMMGLILLIFILSPFGADSTGRYFLPLLLPLAITLGHWVANLAGSAQPSRSPLLRLAPPLLVAGLVLGYQALGQISAARSDYGLTTQFDLLTHLPNEADSQLIQFLLDHDLRHGYSHYWVVYRLAFLSEEALQYSASLPYKANLFYNPADMRYPPYTEATAAAERVAFITAKTPALDTALEAMFQAQNLSYQATRIGEFRIYYDFMPQHPTLDREWLGGP